MTGRFRPLDGRCLQHRGTYRSENGVEVGPLCSNSEPRAVTAASLWFFEAHPHAAARDVYPYNAWPCWDRRGLPLNDQAASIGKLIQEEVATYVTLAEAAV